MKKIKLLGILLIAVQLTFAQTDTIYVWPSNVPNSTKAKSAAVVSDNTSNNVTRLAEVTNPLLVVFSPKEKKAQTSMIVCPGGGYHHLALNMEGYEVAEWLNQLGITAYVLQYQVPDRRDGALNDIQRALRIVRSQNPNDKIGVMGFSAGGSLSARAATSSKAISYTSIDKIDSLSAKPDFGALIYPAYLDLGENRSLTPELTIDDDTPPLFIFGTADDFYGNSALVMTTAMRDHKRQVELHFLNEGGHGYGLRKGNKAAETWPLLMENWLMKEILK